MKFKTHSPNNNYFTRQLQKGQTCHSFPKCTVFCNKRNRLRIDRKTSLLLKFSRKRSNSKIRVSKMHQESHPVVIRIWEKTIPRNVKPQNCQCKSMITLKISTLMEKIATELNKTTRGVNLFLLRTTKRQKTSKIISSSLFRPFFWMEIFNNWHKPILNSKACFCCWNF